MRFSKNKMRLQTDHHILALEYFETSSQTWCKENEMTCEYPTENTLIEWFKTFPHLKRTGLRLVLSDSLFRFYTLARQAKSEQSIGSLPGLDAIKKRLSSDVDQDQDLIDAVLHNQSFEVVCLAKASIEVYLAACKQAKIKIKAISPASYPGFNLLNWRKQRAQAEQIKRILRITLLPIAVLITLMVWITRENAELTRLQLQNQTLSTQIEALSTQKASLPMNTAVQLLQELRFEKEIQFLTINSQGEVTLSGKTASGSTAAALLKRLSSLPEFQANSMREWETHNNQSRKDWQVHFDLKEVSK